MVVHCCCRLWRGATLAAVQWRIRELESGKERLEVEVHKRTRQLEEQNRQIEADKQVIATPVRRTESPGQSQNPLLFQHHPRVPHP